MDQLQERIQEDELEELSQEETPEAPPETPPEITQEALDTGWIPEDQFKGDKSKWRPADEWVERGKTLIPIINSQLKGIKTENATLKEQLEQQRKTTEKLIKMSEKVGQESYERARRELTQKQVAAVGEGDVATWQELEDQKEKLEKPEPIAPEPKAEPSVPAEFKAWVDKNEWFTTDEDMAIFANAHAQRIDPEGKMTITQRCEKVTEKVKELFPHKFSNPARENLSPVDTPSQMGGTKPSGKTYTDLPADAKKQCNIWVKDGTFKSREAYVKSYFEEE